MKLHGILLGMFVGILGTVACGGDDSDDDDGDTGGSAGSSTSGGTTSSGGKGGSGGTSSSGGSSGSGGSGGTDVCDPTMGMGPDTTCQAEIDCLEAECGDDAAECLGAGWSEGDFSGGACGALFTCVNECDCDDFECSLGCFETIDADCTTCLTTLNSCSTACEDEAASCE